MCRSRDARERAQRTFSLDDQLHISAVLRRPTLSERSGARVCLRLRCLDLRLLARDVDEVAPSFAVEGSEPCRGRRAR